MPSLALLVLPFSCVILFTLVLLAKRDLKDGLLPDELVGTLALAGLGLHSITGWSLITPVQALAGIAVGGGSLFLIRETSKTLWKQEGLGLGDVKLMAAAGLLLGYPHIMMALTLGAGLGVVHGLVQWHREPSGVTLAKINVPAGLGLCFGIAIVWLMQYGFAIK